MKITSRLVPLKLIFTPEVLENKDWDWQIIIHEEMQEDLRHAINFPDPYKPRTTPGESVDRQGMVEFLANKLRTGGSQEDIPDIGTVRIKIDVDNIQIGSSSYREGSGNTEIPPVPPSFVKPCIQNLPTRSALLVSNPSSNIISRIRFDGECKPILISSKKIAAFCIVSDSDTGMFWLAVLFRLEAIQDELRLNLFSCDEDVNIDLTKTIACMPNIKLYMKKTIVNNLQQFSRQCLIFSKDCITHFIDFSNVQKIVHYLRAESNIPINCLLADKELLGENILIGRNEKLYLYKINLKKGEVMMTEVYEVSLSPRVPMNILRLKLSANLLLMTLCDSKNQSSIAFALFEILQDRESKRLYVQEAIDIALVLGNNESQNLALIQPHIVIHANSDDCLISIDQSGNLISSTVFKKRRSNDPTFSPGN